MQRSILTTELRAVLFGTALALSALGVSSHASAQGAPVESATAEQKKAAQKAFEDGMKASKAGKHEEAFTAFKASYNAVASPNSHLMMARELVELNRLVDAYAEFQNAQAEAEAAAVKDKKYESAAQSAKNEGNDVRAKLGFVKLNVTGSKPGDRVTVAGREVPESEWSKPIPVMAGSVHIELVSNDGKETVKDVSAPAGSETPVDLAPGTAAAPAQAGGATAGGEASASVETKGGKPNLRTWAYVAGGVGVAGVATFAIFGIMNNSKHSKLQDNCKNNVCPADLQSDADAGKRYQTIANIGLVVGVAGLATGTVLYLISGKNKEQVAKHEPKRGPRVDGVSVGYRSVVVSGSF